MHIASATIYQEHVGFYVDQAGMFSATVLEAGQERTLTQGHDSLKRAKRAARLELKKKQIRVAVPFTTPDLLPAIAKGRHLTQRDTILIWVNDGTEDGKSDTIISRSWHPTMVLDGDISPKALAKIKYLIGERQRTEQRLDKLRDLIAKWTENHSFDLAKAVDEAVAEAAEQDDLDEDELPEIPPTDEEPT